MTSQQIRQQYIDFFVKKHGHTFVASSPVVPLDDPTLLFTNAGMNQFKPIFLGQEKRSYTRAANTQKCIRAGGKHNDLDDVGRSRRHHTFFEMLGNWSFGDYFKREAIAMSWELLTQVFSLDPTRIHVTCYDGYEAYGIPRDTESADLWKEIAGLPDDHIHFFGGMPSDNFWMMGDTGPCGPCTEMHYDRTPDKSGGKDVNGENPDVMEIWNDVFIQYNRNADGSLTPLPARHVDTGMGFERICQILQGADDNYGSDIWQPFFTAIAKVSGKQYTGQFPPTNSPAPAIEAANPQLRTDIGFRVIADHLRCLTFAITDGAIPSNEGRGYVLRRILRRAVRFGRQQLELREPFMHKLVPVVVETMGDAFPELKKDPERVAELIKGEEVSFGKTLDRGIQLFNDAAEAGSISGSDAFKLHDTYGFPIDLTRVMAEERGMTVDIAGYEQRMEQAKELARTGGKDQSSRLPDLSPAALAQLASVDAKPTDDSAKYQNESLQAKVLAIWDGQELGLSPATALEDQQLAIILDRTNFYSEMGGQVGDTGTLTAPTSLDIGKLKQAAASVFDVEATRTVGGYVLHVGRLRSGTIAVGEIVVATVADARDRIEKNHTSTHLLNWALRQTLGDGIQQKGSLVDAEKLRFDFSHPKSLSDDELSSVEKTAMSAIAKNHTVYIAEASQDQALKINGLRAVFGEKYPPMVRVVSIGAPVEDLLSDPTNARWRDYSVEFCGGTHLTRSGQAVLLAVTAEESVSKGVRRISALTGKPASEAWARAKRLEETITSAEQAADDQVPAVLSEINAQLAGGVLPLRTRRHAQAAINSLQVRQKTASKISKSTGGGLDAIAIANDLLASASAIGDGKLIVGEIAGATDEQLRSAMDSLRKKASSSAVMLAAALDGKVTFVAAVSDDLIGKGLKAGDWIRETAKVAGGGGGGRPQMAQAGGKDPSKIGDALQRAKNYAMDTVK